MVDEINAQCIRKNTILTTHKKFVAPAVECSENTNQAGSGFKPGWVLGRQA